MDLIQSVADDSGSGRVGGGDASSPHRDASATAEPPPNLAGSALASTNPKPRNTSAFAAAAPVSGKKSPAPGVTPEDDILLPDPPNVTAVVDRKAVEDEVVADQRLPTSLAPQTQEAAPPGIGSAAQEEHAKNPPQLDLIHQAAILSSVFDDDDAGAAAANAAAAADDDVPPQMVFHSTPDAQPVTEPFDIQLLGPATPFEVQQQDIVISEHVAEISPPPDEHAAVAVEGGGGSHLLLTPNGTLVLSMDSNIVLVDDDHDLTLQHVQQVQGEATPDESSAIPIVSSESNEKTILWSSTAAPGDWPPKTGKQQPTRDESLNLYSTVVSRSFKLNLTHYNRFRMLLVL